MTPVGALAVLSKALQGRAQEEGTRSCIRNHLEGGMELPSRDGEMDLAGVLGIREEWMGLEAGDCTIARLHMER